MTKDLIIITADHEEKGQRVMADLSSVVGIANYSQMMRKRRKEFQSAPQFQSSVPLQGGQSVGQTSEAPQDSAESRSPVTYSFQWRLNGVDIVGQTSRTITLLVGMIGQSLTCAITATNRFGTSIKVTLAVVIIT